MINHFILYLLNANTNVTHKIKNDIYGITDIIKVEYE
jgi:hypothetical protein